jgi:hypothetical protein
MLKNDFMGLLSVETPEKPPKVIESSLNLVNTNFDKMLPLLLDVSTLKLYFCTST